MKPRLVIACSLVTLSAASASAQPRDPALAGTRRDLINQSLAARAANDHARALDLAQRAGQIEMSVSLRRLVAEEQESTGHVAEALNSAELCVREGGAARENLTHVEACRAIAARMQPRVARVTVTVPSPTPEGLRVRVAGNELPSAVWGVPTLVTPGDVTVDAEAPQFRPFHWQVTVAAGATEAVSLSLEAAPVVAPPPPAPPPAPVAAPQVVVVTQPAQPPAEAPQSSSVGPIVLMGVGAAALIASVTFLALSFSDAGEPCADDPSQLCATAQADTFGTVGWVSLGVGASAAVGGLVWFLAQRGGSSHAPRAMLTGAPVAGGGTLGLRLTF